MSSIPAFFRSQCILGISILPNPYLDIGTGKVTFPTQTYAFLSAFGKQENCLHPCSN